MHMSIEMEPKKPAEKILTIRLEDGKELFFPDQKWYPLTKTIADALQKQRRDVGTRLHQIIIKNPSIKFMTVRELEMSGRLRELESEERSQTIICDQENFIKAVIAVSSIKTKPLHHEIRSEPNEHKSPTSKEKKPKNPGENSHSPFNPFSSATLNAKKPQETHRTPPKERLNMKYPKQILAVNSVIKALSLLANRTLQEISHDIQNLLEQVAMEHVQLPRFEGDPTENILKKILDSDSPSRLNRFFTVTLDGMLYDLWDVIDANERRLKEEKEIIEICNKLKRKGYDKKGVIQEIFTHFRISVAGVWL